MNNASLCRVQCVHITKSYMCGGCDLTHNWWHRGTDFSLRSGVVSDGISDALKKLSPNARTLVHLCGFFFITFQVQMRRSFRAEKSNRGVALLSFYLSGLSTGFSLLWVSSDQKRTVGPMTSYTASQNVIKTTDSFPVAGF